MEIITILGVGLLAILGLLAEGRASQYRKLLIESQTELQSIKLSHSKLQLLDYFDRTNGAK